MLCSTRWKQRSRKAAHMRSSAAIPDWESPGLPSGCLSGKASLNHHQPLHENWSCRSPLWERHQTVTLVRMIDDALTKGGAWEAPHLRCFIAVKKCDNGKIGLRPYRWLGEKIPVLWHREEVCYLYKDGAVQVLSAEEALWVGSHPMDLCVSLAQAQSNPHFAQSVGLFVVSQCAMKLIKA